MQIAEKEILTFVASIVHCCITCHMLLSVAKNVIFAS